MRRSGWMAGAKALAATTGLACVAMVASTAAQADYSYTFTFAPNTPGTQFGLASGAFSTGSMIGSGTTIINSGNYSYSYAGQNYSGNFSSNVSYFYDSGSFAIGNGAGFSFRASSSIVAPSGNFSATATINSNAQGASSYGIFESVLTSSPGSGGGGGSGGAPTPEVNAGLGMLIAGASFVFLRRKRGGRHEAVAA
jgi:hypothetical protein